LLEPFLMKSADLGVFLLEYSKTPRERICNLQVLVIFGLVVAAGGGVIERSFHLTDCRDDLLRFLDHLLLLGRHKANLIVQRIGQSREELAVTLSAQHLTHRVPR
jgi:hypothetical protein